VSQTSVEVPEQRELQEIVSLLADLCDAASKLPEGAERQNALQEIRGYQVRIAGLVQSFGLRTA
jgi:hypothetical protein